jgi:hypothetical protein
MPEQEKRELLASLSMLWSLIENEDVDSNLVQHKIKEVRDQLFEIQL